jgi:SAM-dependent methyltransferase
MTAVVDALFADDRLAGLYDLIEDDRSDLFVYAAMVDELHAESVIDVGCGTGTFACLLAQQGKHVVGVDPPLPSLNVARSKTGAGNVVWVHGDATALGHVEADLITMTGNVAQVFISDASWDATLRAARAALAPDGWLVFETRDPAREAWTAWNRAASYRELSLPDGDRLATWVELTAVELPLVSFRHLFTFEARNETLSSDSTLRFRTADELVNSLVAANFRVREIRDAPDRPGLELVVLAQPSP